MTVWFADFPLDFSKAETRQAEKLLIAGFSSNREALRLAQNIGLDPAYLNQGGSLADLMHSILEEARRSERLTWLIAEVLADPSRAALHKPLRTLIAGYEGVLSAAAMQWRPSLATLANLPTLPASLFAPRGAGEEEPRPLPGLEKMIVEAAGFLDPAVFRCKIAEAEMRVARIDIGGHAIGTGFLVGESLLLTNWHVVENGVAGAVTLFDHKVAAPGAVAVAGRSIPFGNDWLVASSGHDAIPVEQGEDGPPLGTWDFALVRLAEPVGAQTIGPGQKRGHYTLDGGLYDFNTAEALFIMGHPNGDPMRLSQGVPANAKRTKFSNRVRYWTNTEGGSSGSPVFNKDWRIVAQHHATGPTVDPSKFDLQTKDFNQGVPISGIVQELRKQLAEKPALAELKLV
jgi:V8-like Glu-specific endopeptidase